MTSVPRLAMKRNDTRTYSTWEWARAYGVLILLLPLMAVLWFLATFVKTLSPSITAKLLRRHDAYTSSHPMDFRIPPNTNVPAYMHRWWRIARNWAFNIYYHNVLRSDDDRALHDHPWFSFSVVLRGGYFEHTILAGGIHRKVWKGPGSMTFRWTGSIAHRLELERVSLMEAPLHSLMNREVEISDATNQKVEVPATTIFITGPVLRRWGFHHESGWVDAYDWDAFCDAQGIRQNMRMDGGSDAAQSPRNLHNAN